MRQGLILSLGVFSALILPWSFAGAADGCPGPNEVKATTQADLDAMRAAGFPQNLIVLGQCWDPTDRSIGRDAGQAKQELNQMWCSSKDSCGGEYTNVEQLDGQYAVCLADFIKKYRQRDPSTCIYSAYRTSSMQTCKCGSGGTGCLPGGMSNHQKGIAADLRVRDYGDMHANVRQYAGLRHLTIASDPYHIEADRSGKCGIGTMSANDGPAQQSPIQNAMSAIRNFFSPPPPPPVIPPPPINPTYDPTQYFSTTTTPYASSTATTNFSTDTTSYATATPRSVSDLISAIAEPPPPQSTTPQTPTGTPIKLNDAIGNVAGLKPGQMPIGQTNQSIEASSLTPNNTFTSQDLSKNPSELSRRDSSTFAALEGLRQTLVRLLSILRPFGGRIAHKTTPAGMPATAE